MIYLWLGIAGLVLLAIDLGMRIYFGRKALKLLEKMPPFHVESVPVQKQATAFNLQSSHGVTLRGSIYHPDSEIPCGIVIFCPEMSSSHWSAVKYCEALIEAGFLVVSFDFRNQGESDTLASYESLHWVTEHEITDLQTVVNWVQDQPSFQGLSIGILGVSRGAATALLALPQLKSVRYLCCDSAYTNDLLIWHYLERWAPIVLPRIVMNSTGRWLWHIKKTLDVAIWLRGWKRNCRYVLSTNPFDKMADKQVLLIGGSGDGYVPPQIGRRIAAKLGVHCQEHWIVPKANHNGSRTLAPSLYDKKIVAFFGQMTPQTTAVPMLGPTRRSESVTTPVH